MPAAAAIVPAVAAVAGGAMQANAAGDAADAQTAAGRESNAVQLAQYNATALLNDPWRMGGGSAYNEYLQMMGLAPQDFVPAADIIRQTTGGISNTGSQSSGGGFDIFNPLGTHSSGGASGALTLDPLGLFGGDGPDITRTDSSPAGAMQVDGIEDNYANWERQGRPEHFDPRTGNAVAAPVARPTLPTTGYTPEQVMQRLTATPGFQFRQSEGQRAVEASAAARGGLNSGSTLRALERYGQDYGTSEYNNYLNRLSTLFGGAQQATANIGNAGQNYANSASQTAINGGNARAGMYQNQADAWGQTIGAVGNSFGNYYGGRG